MALLGNELELKDGTNPFTEGDRLHSIYVDKDGNEFMITFTPKIKPKDDPSDNAAYTYSVRIAQNMPGPYPEMNEDVQEPERVKDLAKSVNQGLTDHVLTIRPSGAKKNSEVCWTFDVNSTKLTTAFYQDVEGYFIKRKEVKHMSDFVKSQ